MNQSIDEVLDNLRSFVAGRGNEDNFCYRELSSNVRCVDFSPWIGMRIAKNDIFALAVFQAQLNRSDGSPEWTAQYNLTADDDELVEEEIYEEVDTSPAAFGREVYKYEQEIKHILQFPFEEYFVNDIRSAKMDLLIAWSLHYPGEPFARAMMPYHLKIKGANKYLEEHNRRRKKQYQLPADLPNDTKFQEFQHQLGKLPLASRLHIFDVFGYALFPSGKQPKPISKMTFYETINVGIDENESANFLLQSPLTTSFPDGTSSIASDYADAFSIAHDYTKKIAPVYYEWSNEVGSLISDQLGVYYYDNDDPTNDGYLGSEEFEE